MTYRRFCLAALATLMLLSWMPAPEAHAQAGSFFNQRDDQYVLLGLKRAKEAYEAAQADYNRQKALADKGLIPPRELEQAERNYSDAEVNYQQSLLAVIFENQYVVVSRAVKYRVSDSRRGVRITIENASRGGSEFEHLIGVQDELFRSLQPDVVNNVYVSLVNEDDAIISQPYEQKIDRLTFGEPVTLNFGLLQDVDAVTVSMIYGNGTQQSRKIFLQKDASVNVASIQAEQFSQEVELGGTTDFDMKLELFSGESNTFKLEVVNLPREINRYFVDPTTSNRLSQFQFNEGVNTREAGLKVFLPDRPTDDVLMDDPIAFYALAIPRERVGEFPNIGSETLSVSDIEAMRVGYTRLELVPRGVGELLVRAQVLSFNIKPGEPVEATIEVVNEGTRSLNNVRVETDPPLNWTDAIDPPVIQSLDINEERRVTMRFTPPEDISPGRYEVRVETTSLSDDLPIRAEDKTVIINVEQETPVFGTILIILLIVGLVVGIVIFGIRLSRR
ncbi:MAG: NEW3 domain-containing protein [Bacteroidota bacterium]